MDKESKSVGLEKKDAMNLARWRVGARKIKWESEIINGSGRS